jgi:hypothetical protein
MITLFSLGSLFFFGLVKKRTFAISVGVMSLTFLAFLLCFYFVAVSDADYPFSRHFAI